MNAFKKLCCTLLSFETLKLLNVQDAAQLLLTTDKGDSANIAENFKKSLLKIHEIKFV